MLIILFRWWHRRLFGSKIDEKRERRLIWAGHVARMEEGRSDFKILKGESTVKRPQGRPRRRREANIRINLKK